MMSDVKRLADKRRCRTLNREEVGSAEVCGRDSPAVCPALRSGCRKALTPEECRTRCKAADAFDCLVVVIGLRVPLVCDRHTIRNSGR